MNKTEVQMSQKYNLNVANIFQMSQIIVQMSKKIDKMNKNIKLKKLLKIDASEFYFLLI